LYLSGFTPTNLMFVNGIAEWEQKELSNVVTMMISFHARDLATCAPSLWNKIETQI
jgi:hypothetical protein